MTDEQKLSDFNNFGLPEAFIQSLEKMGITKPTPIQAATIPLALGGADILASAQTGSGKTIAYVIPLIMKILKSPNSKGIILTPTRELATQVIDALYKILPKSSQMKAALLIGGDSMFKQIAQLRAHPKVIVGTPGRIFDHLNRRTLKLDDTRMLIIDEADRMLDMGFGIQLDKIADYLPKERQTLMFSATMPPNIDKLSKKYLQDPQRVSIDTATQEPPKIKQEIIHTSGGEKFSHLLKELDLREGSIIMFVKTKRSADKISNELSKLGYSTDAIHGDLQQRRRDRVIHSFRTGKCRILVATDIAARGLDIPHIKHVINFDLPQCPEDYIHRIGRTARAGAEGNALCLISPEDNFKWRAIHRMMNPGVPLPGGDREDRSAPKKGGRRFGNKRFGGSSSFKPRAGGGGNGGGNRSSFPKQGGGGGFFGTPKPRRAAPRD